MAVPDSLAAWRTFVERKFVEPVPMSMAGLEALDPAMRAEYDQTRFAWLGADIVLPTHDTETLQRQAKIILARNAALSATARRGLVITGKPTLGKSTTAMLIGKRHERAMRTKYERFDRGFAPVTYVVVPAGTTPKMLMLSFANFLGLIPRSRATAQDLANQVIAVLRDLRTSLVIVDEVHNLRTSRSAGAEAASSLKGFSERLDATFIYAGIDLLDSDLFQDDEIGTQMKGRMIVHEVSPFGFATQSQRDAWVDIVLACENLLPLANHLNGRLEGQSRYLWDRTGGSIGALRALLTDAAIAAIQSGSEQVTCSLLESIRTYQQAEEFVPPTAAKSPPGKRTR
ncbi:TniB family NTP-binding protein [bacterium RCC_150]